MTTYAATIKPEQFTPGVEVGAYPRALYTADDQRGPLGTPEDTDTVASDGSASFSGLLSRADYYAMETPQNQALSLTIDATGATFDLTTADEAQTGLAYNISAADLKTALVALLDVTTSDLTVTGGPGDSGGTTPYVITFVGAQAHTANVPTFAADGTNLTGGAHTATLAVTNNGRAGGENRVIFQAR